MLVFTLDCNNSYSTFVISLDFFHLKDFGMQDAGVKI